MAEGTHETNTTGDDETNATGDDALVLETLIEASGPAVETFFNSQDSSIESAEGTHERNTAGDDETNATGDNALVLGTPGISFPAAKLVRV